MMNYQVAELLSELKKIRNDQDAMKAYLKTIAENTTPAETPSEPSSGDT